MSCQIIGGILVSLVNGTLVVLEAIPPAGTPSTFGPGLDPRTLRFPGPVQLLCVSSSYPASGLDPAHAVSKKKPTKNPHNISWKLAYPSASP